MVQKRKELAVCGIVATLLFSFGSIFAYYIVERDRNTRRMKAGERAHETVMKLLCQIENNQMTIKSAVERFSGADIDSALNQFDKWYNDVEILLSETQNVEPMINRLGNNMELTESERLSTDQLRTKRQFLMDTLNDLFTFLRTSGESYRRNQEKETEILLEDHEEMYDYEDEDSEIILQNEEPSDDDTFENRRIYIENSSLVNINAQTETIEIHV